MRIAPIVVEKNLAGFPRDLPLRGETWRPAETDSEFRIELFESMPDF
jgi:hypothetical protein